MSTPLVDTLLEHIRRNPAPFHMPGHKGRMKELEAMAQVAALDVTELPDTADLYAGGDAIAQAEALWAAVWGLPHCQFLTGGSTQGIHAALLLCARRGREILVDRCCHRSVYNALALFDLEPTYLLRRQTAPLEPREVDRLLTQHPEIKTVCITSPTYYGVASNVTGIALICHAHGAWLVVDGAHGAHLPFFAGEGVYGQADLVVSSAHKTMNAYGQAALLFGGADVTAEELRWAASVCGTSSPSFPVLASLDYAREHLESPKGRANMEWAVREVLALRESFPHLETAGATDPLRFVLAVNVAAAAGYEVKDWLERRGVFPEMADRDYVVFLLSGNNQEEDVTRLVLALQELPEVWPGIYDPVFPPAVLPELPQRRLTPAQALMAPRRRGALFESEGRVCLSQVAPYPPGVPVVAPGEVISKKTLAYLREIGYNGPETVFILPE